MNHKSVVRPLVCIPSIKIHYHLWPFLRIDDPQPDVNQEAESVVTETASKAATTDISLESPSSGRKGDPLCTFEDLQLYTVLMHS